MTNRADTAIHREADALGHVAELLEALEAAQREQSRMWRSLTDSGVLGTELVLLPASGIWTRDWGVPYRTVHVANQGVAAMWVTSESPGGFAPGPSPGLQRIPAGASGTFALRGRAVTLYGAAGDYANVQVFERAYPPGFDGGVPEPCGTGTITTAAVTAASAVALAANAQRKGALIYNEGAAIVYLALAATATLTAYTVQLASGALFELPGPSVYVGAVAALTAAGTATLRVTELS